jgi:hypothetical protein
MFDREAYSIERAGVFARHTAAIIARKIAEAEAEAKEKADRAHEHKKIGRANRQNQLLKQSMELQAKLLKEAPMKAKKEAFKKEMAPYLKYAFKKSITPSYLSFPGGLPFARTLSS